jgi:predicted nucleic acid-binding protein
MIVVDTNVLSEVMKPSPAPAVVVWLAGVELEGLFTTVVNEAEIRLGIELLPNGRRKRELQEAAERIIALFDIRILSFDSMATQYFAQIVAGRRRMGQPIDDLDAQIAAVARSHHMALATRNVLDFHGTGIKVLDPWRV